MVVPLNVIHAISPDLFGGGDYLDTVIRHHTSGRLKVAPGTYRDAVLATIRNSRRS